MFLRQSVFLVQCPLLYVQREQPERLTASRRCQKLWSHAASRASLTSRAIIFSFCAWQAVIRIDGFAHRRDISAARLRVTDRQRRTTEGNVFLLRGAARLTRTECRLLMSASLTSGREREREKLPSNRKLNHRGRKKKKVSPLSLVVHHVHSYWKKSTVFVRFWSIRNWERSLLPEEIILKFSFWHHTTSHFFFVFFYPIRLAFTTTTCPSMLSRGHAFLHPPPSYSAVWTVPAVLSALSAAFSDGRPVARRSNRAAGTRPGLAALTVLSPNKGPAAALTNWHKQAASKKKVN